MKAFLCIQPALSALRYNFHLYLIYYLEGKEFGPIQNGMTGEVVIDGEQHDKECSDYLWVEWHKNVGGLGDFKVLPYRSVGPKRCYPIVRHAVIILAIDSQS